MCSNNLKCLGKFLSIYGPSLARATAPELTPRPAETRTRPNRRGRQRLAFYIAKLLNYITSCFRPPQHALGVVLLDLTIVLIRAICRQGLCEIRGIQWLAIGNLDIHHGVGRGHRSNIWIFEVGEQDSCRMVGEERERERERERSDCSYPRPVSAAHNSIVNPDQILLVAENPPGFTRTCRYPALCIAAAGRRVGADYDTFTPLFRQSLPPVA